MFKKLTKFIVNQMDPCKELVPVENVADNEHFRPLYLLKKKRKSKNIFHSAPYYQWTGFTLHDVLLPGEDGKSIESLLQVSSQITIKKTCKDQADGGLSVSRDPANADLQGGASLSKEFSITPQKKSISLQSLEALKEREINMDHSFIRQLRRRGINLYVVTEILEASEETVYKESTKADGGFKAKFYATFHAKNTWKDKQTIVIPKGCTLAFRTVPLLIRNGAWDLDYFAADTMKNVACADDGPSHEVVVREVNYSLGNFPELSRHQMRNFLNFISAVMRDRNLFQEPSQKAQIHLALLQNLSHNRMFKKFTKGIVKQMDPCKELVPVESITDNEHFKPLYLLKRNRKSKTMFHPAPYYQPTGFTLHDVLLPGEDESLLQDSSQYTHIKTSTDQPDGGLRTSCEPASVDMQGDASSSKAFSVKPQKKSISLQSLEALRRERKINMDHFLIRQLQKTDIDLYVVTEILETSEETVYKESTKADGGFKATLYDTFFAKGNRENNQAIIIPKGCTLAFRTIPLLIRDGEWDVGYFPTAQTRSLNGKVESMGKLEEVVSEVEHRCQIFSKLSPDLLLIVFNTIKAVMKDKNLLQELRQTMEDIPEQNDEYKLKTESPDLKDLFSTLQHSPRDRLLLCAEGITYVLDALHELMDDQLWLLLESLERNILSQQLKLVEDLLKHDLDKGKIFHVDARLLSFPHKDEQMLTMELVELSGVQLQEDGSAVPRDQPFESVIALFMALYALNLLSGSK